MHDATNWTDFPRSLHLCRCRLWLLTHLLSDNKVTHATRPCTHRPPPPPTLTVVGRKWPLMTQSTHALLDLSLSNLMPHYQYFSSYRVEVRGASIVATLHSTVKDASQKEPAKQKWTCQTRGLKVVGSVREVSFEGFLECGQRAGDSEDGSCGREGASGGGAQAGRRWAARLWRAFVRWGGEVWSGTGSRVGSLSSSLCNETVPPRGDGR